MSRTTAEKRKSPLSSEDKNRLLKISKRPRRGPFNSVMDPTEFGAGSASLGLSEAVKNSGAYDPWAPKEEEEEIKDGMETVQPKKIKVRFCCCFAGMVVYIGLGACAWPSPR